MSCLPKTSKRNLLLLAGIVWGFAGASVLRIGIVAYHNHVNGWNIAASIGVFSAFWKSVFENMVRKHTNRILGYQEERQYILKFFDRKGFIIMAFMMTFGIGLRLSGRCPEGFIAVFYTGLGAALLLAGLQFLLQFRNEGKNHLVANLD